MSVPAAGNLERKDSESFRLNTTLELSRTDRFWIKESGIGFGPLVVFLWIAHAFYSSLQIKYRANLYDSVWSINPCEVILNILCSFLLHMGVFRTKLLFVAPCSLFVSYGLISNQFPATFGLIKHMTTMRRVPTRSWMILGLFMVISALRIQEWLMCTALMMKLLKLKFYMKRNAARISANFITSSEQLARN